MRRTLSHPPPKGLPKTLSEVSTGGILLLRKKNPMSNLVVNHFIESEDVVLLSGREKDAFKTWLALDLCIARITGTPWIGFDVTQGEGSTLFVSAETSTGHIAQRAASLCRARGFSPESVFNRLVVMDQPLTMLPSNQRGSSRNGHVLTDIENAEHGTFSLIVLDTLRQCMEGDENSSRDTARFTQAVRHLAKSARCPVLLIHHTNKSGDASDPRSSRGSVELTASPDVLLSVNVSGSHPTLHFKTRNCEAPSPRGYKLDKYEGGLRLLDTVPSIKSSDFDSKILALLEARQPQALTQTNLRNLLEGCNLDSMKAALGRLEAAKQVSRVSIEGTKLVGFRFGQNERGDVRRQILNGSGSPTDV